MPASSAKGSEWVTPRWPSGSRYGMPSAKLTTSRSGSTVRAISTQARRPRGTAVGPSGVSSAPTKAWVNAVATSHPGRRERRMNSTTRARLAAGHRCPPPWISLTKRLPAPAASYLLFTQACTAATPSTGKSGSRAPLDRKSGRPPSRPRIWAVSMGSGRASTPGR